MTEIDQLSDAQKHKQGVWLAIITYSIWGLFPFYFNLLKSVSAIEILVHRIFWTSVLTLIFILINGRYKLVWDIFKSPKLLSPYVLSSVFLAINWGLYIYGIVLGDVLQLSLAYFINPLFNVLFGVLIFKEKLGLLSKVAIAIALVGVLYRALGVGGVPILAITIAVAFSLYGVLRKGTKADSISALFIESTLILPFIVFAFFVYTPRESIELIMSNVYWLVLFVLAGPVTSIPLITFSMTVKRIPYYLVGFYQYLAPTILFLSAIFVFKESWSVADLITFGLVWVGILLVIVEQLRRKPN